MKSVYSNLSEELKQSLKDRDLAKATIIRTLLSEIKNYALELKKPVEDLQDEDIQKVLLKQAKQRKESIEAFKKGNRLDLVEKEQRELDLIQKYLPEQLSPQETQTAVEEALKNLNVSDLSQMGQIMAYLKQKYGSAINMGLASQKVRELLTK